MYENEVCGAFFALAIHTSALFAQTKKSDAHVTGHVTDSSTGEHLPFVSIVDEVPLRDATIYLWTDYAANGLFWSEGGDVS